jgi:hypothetical protein
MTSVISTYKRSPNVSNIFCMTSRGIQSGMSTG